MDDKDKTKEELIRALSELRRENAALLKKDPDQLKSAFATAREEKTRAEAVIAALGDAVSIQDTDFKILYQNQVSKEIYGDHVGEYCYRGYKNQGQVCEHCHLAQTFADGQIHRVEQSRNTDKGMRYYDKTVSPLKDPSGKIIAGIELVRDITERKKTGDILLLSQRVLDTSPDHISIVGPDYIYKHVNKAYTAAHDLPVDQIVGRHVSDLLGKDIFEKTVRPNLDRCLAGEEIQYEAWFFFKKKGRRYMSVKYLPMKNRAGDIDGVNVFSQDITERKKAEEALQESESHFRKVVENSPLSMALVNADGIIEYINLKAIETFGYLPQDIPTMDRWWAQAYPDKTYRDTVIAQWTGLVIEALKNNHEIEQREYRVTCRNGSVKVMVIFGVWIADKVLVIFDDVTERKQLEQEMIKTQKLEAIGTLAGGIAHDFNNLLQGIFGYISMAKITIDQKDRSLAMLEQAEHALHMSVNLTTQLLTFSKGGKPVKSIVHLRPLIENSVKFALSGSRSEYRIMLDEDLRAVEADEGQIAQVIQNIVLNAEQAMPEGGIIVIKARNENQEHAHCKVLGPGKYVEISVRDTGIGIPEKYLQKIFEPYFTTKEKGSGLGLATSYSIVRNHGGIIEVESEAGTGTTFFIYLPAVEAAGEIRKEPAAAAFAGKGKILVMDDEELVLNVAGEMIKDLGHEVDLAKHGQSAIEKYRAAMESGKPFDVVILDLTVRGGMDGREALERLRLIDPGVKAIVSSGYSEDPVIADYEKYGFRARLPKPYRLAGLRDTLNLLLG